LLTRSPCLATPFPAPRASRAHRGKIKSAREAARLIRSGDTVATGGFVGIGFPVAIAVALEARSARSAAPTASASRAT
jgi:propionate CoA-transferase